jgi:hypothetical protein
MSLSCQYDGGCELLAEQESSYCAFHDEVVDRDDSIPADTIRLPIAFRGGRARWDGCHEVYRQAPRNQYHREWYKRHRDQRVARLAGERKRQRDFRHEWLRANGPCFMCGASSKLRPFHPTIPSVCRVWAWAAQRRDLTLAECRVACARCKRSRVALP